ncbi:MAG: chromosome partitioning protein ParA [Coriobacteriia bacterium]|nr:chromosome partitioning protein ParA [Coriobacteriia bacterium]
MSKVALCVDAESAQYPQVLGLPDESLIAQSWLELLCTAEEARQRLAQAADIEQTWVVSCDDMEAVNLAAACKADAPGRPVLLVSQDIGGSVRSCAAKAGLDDVIDLAELGRRYGQRKAQHAALAAAHMDQAYPPASPSVGEKAVVPAGSGAAASAGAGAGEMAPAVSPPASVVAASAERLAARPDLSGLGVMPAEGKAFFLPVVSGSGGAGKSTVSLLAALLTQQAGLQTLLIDFDPQFGDLDALLGCGDAMGIDDLVRSPLRAAQLAPRGGLPAFLKAPVRLEDAEQLANQIPWVMDAVQGRFDVVIANTGGFWTEIQAQLLERSSKALFLIDQRPSSLRACKRALDLCARCGIAASPFVFAPNRCSKGGLYTSIDVSCALHGAVSFELAEGGYDVEDALAEGRPLDLISEGNELVDSLDDLLRQIMPSYQQAVERAGDGPRRQSLWQRLGFGRRRPGEVTGHVAERESA